MDEHGGSYGDSNENPADLSSMHGHTYRRNVSEGYPHETWADWSPSEDECLSGNEAPVPPAISRRQFDHDELPSWKARLWHTRHEAKQPQAVRVHARRLRHAVSKDVALACAEVRVQRVRIHCTLHTNFLCNAPKVFMRKT
eukprot:SAG31_NODE_2399_length_5776_cov_8.236216_5_plen_141_part_00